MEVGGIAKVSPPEYFFFIFVYVFFSKSIKKQDLLLDSSRNDESDVIA